MGANFFLQNFADFASVFPILHSAKNLNICKCPPNAVPKMHWYAEKSLQNKLGFNHLCHNFKFSSQGEVFQNLSVLLAAKFFFLAVWWLMVSIKAKELGKILRNAGLKHAPYQCICCCPFPRFQWHSWFTAYGSTTLSHPCRDALSPSQAMIS